MEKVRLLPGFLRGRVFVSEDGDNLVTITEWADRESFQQFRQSEFCQAAVRLAAEPLRLDVKGDLAVRAQSADGRPHPVRLRVLTARGLRAEGE